MTAPTVDRPTPEPEDLAPGEVEADAAAVGPEAEGGEPEGGEGEGAAAPEEPEGPILRPLLVAALSSTAAALMTGGIFGSWSARLMGTAAALLGVFWAWLVLRSRARRLLIQSLLMPTAIVLGALAAIPGSNGSSPLHLIGEAVKSGRLLRPPVPFEAGWRPVLIVMFIIIGFAAAWVGTALRRPQVGLLLPLTVLALTAISQPAEGEFIAGILGVVPIIAAIAVLFGGDVSTASQLTRQFEVKRLIRGAIALALAVGLLILLNQSNFLFPKPAYNPAQKPQKPKAIPLSAARDRVLFEVQGSITGPWMIGTLDIYDGTTWRLPPYEQKRLKAVPGDGVVDRLHTGDVTVKFTIRDLGTSATLPGTALPVKFNGPGQAIVFDSRTDTFRIRTGKVPPGYSYSVSLPNYPTGKQLHDALPLQKSGMKPYLDVPKPPQAVTQLLASAPSNPWDRLDYLRGALNKVVVATGAGVPGPVPPSKVQDLLAGKHEGTPYEIVASEALLARWAGVPSRIGFGFDGSNKEGNLLTVRPKNAAQFLQVYFEGYGWVPIIGAPPKAKTDLNTDPNAKFNPTVQPSDDIAVELYIPIQLENLRQLYQRVRDVMLQLLPFAVAFLLGYLALPYLHKARRRLKRRRWAASHGTAAQLAVEYAELRDQATDLGVGDPYDTPLEYLQRVVEDDEHAELAWLVTRTLYGDLAGSMTAADVEVGREMSESLRRRMFRAQPLQTRVIAVLSRASLQDPYTVEVPGVRLLTLKRQAKPKKAERRPGATRPRKVRARRARRRVGQRAAR